MKKTLFCFAFYSLFVQIKAQCLVKDGIGDFEHTLLTDHYIAAGQGNGSFALSTQEQVKGNQSLKVEVVKSGPWQVRIYNKSACDFNKSNKQSFTASCYLKGPTGAKVNLSIMDHTSVDQASDITLTSSEWTLYQVSFQSSSTSAQGKIKLIFTDTGTYYLDDLQVNAYDCAGVLAGLATFDDCGICSGGQTGITPITSCEFEDVLPSNNLLVYEGALEKDQTDDLITFYRVKKNYALQELPGYYTSERAVASSGICIRFKTDQANYRGE